MAVTPTLTPVPPTGAADKPPAERKRPKKVLPTNRIGLPKQLVILRAWASASGAGGKVVTNGEVGKIMEMAADTISLANPFFADIKLLEKVEGGYLPTQPTLDFSTAYEWDPDKAAHRLGPALSESWFGCTLLPRLRVNPMAETDAITTLAEVAGATPAYRQQLVYCLEYLAVAGLVERENGQVRWLSQRSVSSSADTGSVSETERREPPRISAVTTSFAQGGTPEGQVQFSVSIRVSMAELAGWEADRITAFFSGLAAVLAAKGGVEQDVSSP